MKRTIIVAASLLTLCSCTGLREMTYDHPVGAQFGSDYVPAETFTVAFADLRDGAQTPDLTAADVVIKLSDSGYEISSFGWEDTYTDVLPGCTSAVVETSGYALVSALDCPTEDLLDGTIRSGVDKIWILILPAECSDLCMYSFTDVIAAQRGGEPTPETHPVIYAYNGSWSYMGEVVFSGNYAVFTLEKRERL